MTASGHYKLRIEEKLWIIRAFFASGPDLKFDRFNSVNSDPSYGLGLFA
jgi:hypothetical protein